MCCSGQYYSALFNSKIFKPALCPAPGFDQKIDLMSYPPARATQCRGQEVIDTLPFTGVFCTHSPLLTGHIMSLCWLWRVYQWFFDLSLKTGYSTLFALLHLLAFSLKV